MSEILRYIPADPEPTIDYAREAWKWFMGQYIYMQDRHKRGVMDYWESLVPALIRIQREQSGMSVIGDCDDGALTLADILLAAGFPTDRLVLIRCKSPQAYASITLDHAILWIRDEADQVWWCADVWDASTRSDLYVVSSPRDPGHRPIDAQYLPINKNDKWLDITAIRDPE